MESPSADLRPLLFSSSAWYKSLSESHEDTWPVWRITTSDEPAWWVDVLNVAAEFAQDHGLLDHYRAKFAGIPPGALTLKEAEAKGRRSTFPIWEIANELIVGRYLERVLGWRYESHEPLGRHQHRGDWEGETGVYSRAIQSPRLRSVLKGAYRQLPDDGRSTLVVMVADEILRVPAGIIHGDLFQTLYGRTEFRFKVLPYDPESLRITPSFRDMFTHGTKHRRLGAVAGMVISGMEMPRVQFYAIHNPYAHEAVRLLPSALGDARQFVVEDTGAGHEVSGIDTDIVWQRMS
jgi:hypothetical protein